MKGLIFYTAYAVIGLIVVALLASPSPKPAAPIYQLHPAIYQSLSEV